MEQIKAFTTEMDEIMTVKVAQANKIKQLQAELDNLQKSHKEQPSKFAISKPNLSAIGKKFLQHLDEI